jgi:hypothetical protein
MTKGDYDIVGPNKDSSGLDGWSVVAVGVFHQVGHERPIALKVGPEPAVYMGLEQAYDLMVQLTMALNDYHRWLQKNRRVK